MKPSRVACVVASVAIAAACDQSGPAPPDAGPTLSQTQLEDPTICTECHKSHYDEWASSMHAYAADDPIFLAMNARGQRETNGALGSFCVQCHAPMAVRAGLTTDGLNLASLPAWSKGVTCYFCHVVSDSTDTNDDPLVLASDGVMRGAITDPAPGAPHASGYSVLHDQHQLTSSQLCGSCHDIVNQRGVPIERTFAEWAASEFSHLQSATDNTRSCATCHMPSSQAQASTQPTTSPVREVHDHSMPAVDLALVPYPTEYAQQPLVQQFVDGAVSIQLCVSNGSAQVTLTSQNVGHSWPSGALQDRRGWLELVATTAGTVGFQTGVVADGQSVTAISDPNLWLLRETLLDGNGTEVPFMWEAYSVGTTSVLPAATSVSGAGANHSVTRTFTVPASTDHVTARVRLTAIDQAQLDDLVASGDLAVSVRNAMPVLSVAGTTVAWDASGPACVP